MASSSIPPAAAPAATAAPGPGFGFASKTKKKHFVQQKVKVFRAADPLVGVFLWGVAHSVRPGPRPGGPAEPLSSCAPASQLPGSRLPSPSRGHSPRGRPGRRPRHPPAYLLALDLSRTQTFVCPSALYSSALGPPSPPAAQLPASFRPDPASAPGPGPGWKDVRGSGSSGLAAVRSRVSVCVWKGSREGGWVRGIVHFPFRLAFQPPSLTLEPWLWGKRQASRTF